MLAQNNKLIELNGEIEFFQEDKWLSNACKRYCINGERIEKIPTNIILDKTLTGIGVTTWELKALRDSIIIVPNVPVILAKADKSMYSVYEGVKPPNIRKYLERTDIDYHKILTTPEGFWKIMNAASEANIDIKSQYFCLFDECEKITQDIEYRDKMIAPLDDFFEFEGKAFVSATPLVITHIAFKDQNFQKVKVKPMFNYQKPLTLITTNDFSFQVKEKIELLQDSKCVFVFYNSISGITAIISALGIKGESKIFCSVKSWKKLKSDGYDCSYEISNTLSKYNFFTSSFFSALDIDIRLKADILILSNLNKAKHSIIDPFTETIQIQGRFRHVFEDGTTFKSLTHITNLNPHYKAKKPEQIEAEINQHKDIFFNLKEERQALKKEIENETDPNKQLILNARYDAYSDNLRVLFVGKLLDKHRKWSYFAVDNYYNEERTKGYYTTEEALVNAYEETNHFYVTHVSDVFSFRLPMKEFQSAPSRQTEKSIIKRLVPMISNLDSDQLENSQRMLMKRVDHKTAKIVELTFNAVKNLDISIFETNNYNPKKIQKALEKHYDEKKRFSGDVLGEILQAMNKLPKNEKNHIAKTAIQSALKGIYKRYGITKKASQDTIKDYYGKDDCKENNKTIPYSFELIRMKPEYADIAELAMNAQDN